LVARSRVVDVNARGDGRDPGARGSFEGQVLKIQLPGWTSMPSASPPHPALPRNVQKCSSGIFDLRAPRRACRDGPYPSSPHPHLRPTLPFRTPVPASRPPPSPRRHMACLPPPHHLLPLPPIPVQMRVSPAALLCSEPIRWTAPRRSRNSRGTSTGKTW